MVLPRVEEYQRNRIETASPLELIIMLYDGAIKFLKISKGNIEEKDIPAANDNLIRAQNVIRELRRCLDMDIEEVSPGMYGLYLYMDRQLVQANLKKNIEPIDEVLRMLSDLRDSWSQLSRHSFV